MSWNLSGHGIEMCSCEVFCPCWVTPNVAPDQGWCAGLFAWDCEAGESDGVDMTGVKFGLLADWPGNFHEGKGKGRVLVDSGVSEAQRSEILSVFDGGKDGAVPALWGAVINEWLTPSDVDIDIDWSDKRLTISDVGEANLTSITDANGNQTHIFNSVSQVAIGINQLDLMSVDSPTIADPELRQWTAKDGVKFDFSWSD